MAELAGIGLATTATTREDYMIAAEACRRGAHRAPIDRKTLYLCPACSVLWRSDVVTWNGSPRCPEHPGVVLESQEYEDKGELPVARRL